MATAWVERRLAAILAADVVGYSHLFEQDEAGTLSALKALRREVFDPLLAAHHGRIVKLMAREVLQTLVVQIRVRSSARSPILTDD